MADVTAALERTAAKAGRQHPSVAVLPFANMSRDPDDEYFSDGLAEELINLLAHVPDLKVTARTSSFAFRGREQDIRRIAESLGVGTILEGSVRRAGSRIRVTAQLINAEDGYHLWSERYDRELTDVFEIQDDIAQAIASALQLKLAAKADRHTPQCSGLRGAAQSPASLARVSAGGPRTGQGICEQAIALDPDYAAPHALLGFNYLLATTHSGRTMPDVAPLIRQEALRALELDPFETDPHFLLGAVAAVHDYDWIEAGRQFQLAMASPSVPAEAHWAYAAFYLGALGNFQESTAQMRSAVERDPLSVLWRGILMGHMVCAGRFEEALQEGQKALEISDAEMHPHLALAEAYLALGKIGEAAAAAERAHRNLPQQSMGAGLFAAVLFRAGEKDRAAALLREIGDSPTPIWGRSGTLAMWRAGRRRLVVREDDRCPRYVRTGLCQFSLYRRTAAQPSLGQIGADDEPAGLALLRRCAPRFNSRERRPPPSGSAQRASSSTDASSWNFAIALHTSRPMPLAIWCNPTMLCARKIQNGLVARVGLPPAAPGARPSNGAHAAATPERIGVLGFRHHRHAHPVAVTDLEEWTAKHPGRITLLPGQLIGSHSRQRLRT